MSVGSAEGEACALGKYIGNVINGVGEGKGDIVHEGSKFKVVWSKLKCLGKVHVGRNENALWVPRNRDVYGYFPLSASTNENGPLKPSAGNSDSNVYEKDEAIMLLLFC